MRKTTSTKADDKCNCSFGLPCYLWYFLCPNQYYSSDAINFPVKIHNTHKNPENLSLYPSTPNRSIHPGPRTRGNGDLVEPLIMDPQVVIMRWLFVFGMAQEGSTGAAFMNCHCNDQIQIQL